MRRYKTSPEPPVALIRVSKPGKDKKRAKAPEGIAQRCRRRGLELLGRRKTGLIWLYLAAFMGDVMAMYSLGMWHIKCGRGEKAALSWLEWAAEKDCPEAMLEFSRYMPAETAGAFYYRVRALQFIRDGVPER